jgi:hypothetical protein
MLVHVELEDACELLWTESVLGFLISYCRKFFLHELRKSEEGIGQ